MSNAMAIPAHLSITEPTYGCRSLTGNRSDDMDMAQNLDYCDTQFDFQNPHWLVADDFDIDALNHSIMTRSAGFRTPNSSLNFGNVDRGFGGNAVAEPKSSDLDIQQMEELQKRWYTYIDQEQTTVTGQITPDGVAQRTQVDEVYRVNLSQKLQPHLSDDPLPSTEFLVIDVYSQRCRPLAYVCHRICVFRCTSPASTQYSQSCMHRPFDLQPQSHCCCCQCAPWGACSSDPREPQLRASRYFGGLTKRSWQRLVAIWDFRHKGY